MSSTTTKYDVLPTWYMVCSRCGGDQMYKGYRVPSSCPNCGQPYLIHRELHRLSEELHISEERTMNRTRRLLRIEAPYFVAGAEFEKSAGKWHCVRAAPIIKWMVGTPTDKIVAWLKTKGYSYQWLTGSPWAGFYEEVD